MQGGGARAGRDATKGIPLEWAAMLFRHRLPALYYAPQLWQTTDGVIPYERFWLEFQGMRASGALAQLDAADAHRMAVLSLHGEDGLRRRAWRDAFPMAGD